MAIIVPSKKIITRPQQPVVLDESNWLLDGCTYLSNVTDRYPYDHIRGGYGTPTDTVVDNGISKLGPGAQINNGSASPIVIASNSDDIFPLNRVTVAIIREKRDTTNRASSLFGYRTNTTNTVNAAAPYSNGTLYWDYGTESGRLQVAGQTWDTGVDNFIFLAGPNKGREVWRNGIRIGKSASTNARPSNTISCKLGASAAVWVSDSIFIYYFGVFDAEWSDDKIKSWFENPYQVFKNPRARLSLYFELALLQSSRFDNTQTFYSPTVVDDKLLTQSSRFNNSQTFNAHSILFDQVLTQSSRFDNENTYNEHIIGDGLFIDQGSIFNNANTFNQHSILSINTITQDSRFDNTNTFYAATVESATTLTQSARFDNTQTFYSPEITLPLVEWGYNGQNSIDVYTDYEFGYNGQNKLDAYQTIVFGYAAENKIDAYETKQFAYSAQNTLDAFEPVEFGYSAQNNIAAYIAMAFSYNAQNAIAVYGTVQFAYNSQNKIQAYELKQFGYSAQNAIAAYQITEFSNNFENTLNAYTTALFNYSAQNAIAAYVDSYFNYAAQNSIDIYSEVLFNFTLENKINVYDSVEFNYTGQNVIDAYIDAYFSIWAQNSISIYEPVHFNYSAQNAIAPYELVVFGYSAQNTLNDYTATLFSYGAQNAIDAAEKFYAYAINLLTGAISKYENFDFTSTSGTLGTRTDGLYELGGATDHGTPIEGFIETGNLDFGKVQDKRITDAFINKDGGELTLYVDSENTDYLDYSVMESEQMENIKVNLARGAKGRRNKIKIANVSGSQSVVSDIELIVEDLTRR